MPTNSVEPVEVHPTERKVWPALGRLHLFAFYLVAASPGMIALVRDGNPGFGTDIDALQLSVGLVVVATLALLVTLAFLLGALWRSNDALDRRADAALALARDLAARLDRRPSDT